MAVKPSEVVRSDERVVDEVEHNVDVYLLDKNNSSESNGTEGTIPISLTPEQRAELVRRYEKAGWHAEVKDHNERSPREYSWTGLALRPKR